ncbi:hypothetical protein SDC9_120413 [bioreactor metagenome]|uniref:Uncharacterized protein n=1 Tax=bioreactor metagenome TaxID=1076179 RepID=A0A645C998_9ZZZZ
MKKIFLFFTAAIAMTFFMSFQSEVKAAST